MHRRERGGERDMEMHRRKGLKSHGEEVHRCTEMKVWRERKRERDVEEKV